MITVNSTTYKDDFEQTDLTAGTEDKNYLRILFNGGRSVQIRELNQLQSVLQSQIDKFGSSIYKQGVAVLGGNCVFDPKITVITFDADDLIGYVPTQMVGLSQTPPVGNEVKAEVIAIDANDITVTYYVRYSTGGGEDGLGVFDVNNPITLEAAPGFNDAGPTPISAGLAAGMFLSDGVFFVNGSFVVTPKQSHFVPIVDEINGITGKVVLEVTENIVSYTNDQSLLDNAQGTPNHLAPGADRYQILLTLGFLDSTAAADTINRITLHEIVDSNIVIASKSRYTDLDRQLAQRTVEESGNYILNPFKIEIKDLVGSQRPGSTDIDAPDRVYIGLDPSVAYVDGYRIELGKRLDLTAPRARSSDEKKVSISLNFGNFVDISPVSGSAMPLPNIVNLTYELHTAIIPATEIVTGHSYRIDTTGTSNFSAIGADGSPAPGELFVANATPPTGDGTVIPVVGSTRIKAIESVGALFRLFLYDITLNAGVNLADIKWIANITGGINLLVESAVQNTSNDTAVFKLPYDNVKSMSADDFSYVKKGYWEDDSLDGPTFTINASGVTGESFEDASISNFIVEVDGVLLPTNAISVAAFSSGAITIESSGTPWSIGQSIKVIFPVKVETTTHGVKKLTTVTNDNPPGPTYEGVLTPVNGVYTLSKSDIFDIIKVEINATDVDITGDIEILSDGQRSSFYTNGTLRYIGPPADAPVIKVSYRYFLHESGPPYSIASYNISPTADGDEEILYEELPSWAGFSLGDAIDFRPTILADAGTTTEMQPDPNSAMTCKPTFYQPRIDKVIVNANGEFLIAAGVPEQNPISPATPPAAMALYELYYPAYTYKASDVIINPQDNRRYTMRDIGKLDKRISNLEYYTSLSLLETSTNEKSIFDDVQGARFKNGILTDSFNGHGVGNVLNTAYKCSVDRKAQTLRPFYYSDGVDLVLNREALSGVSIHENTVTLEVTDEVPIISQLVSSESESVNPYDVATFVGNIKLYPTNDKWVETSRRPDIIVNDNSAFDAFALLAEEEGILGTEWGAWETDWVGVDVTRLGRGRWWRRRRAQVTVTTQQTRVGEVTTLDSTVNTQNLGDRVVDVSFVPFIRSRMVYFHAKGLKPDTRVYPYFDGISIEAYCAPADAVIPASDLDQVREYFNQEPGSEGFIEQGNLISGTTGELIGAFIVPNNQLLKFRVGDRIFKLTDSNTNNIEEETTYAEGTYSAAGTLQTIEATILSTRIPELKRERVEESRTLTQRRRRWRDPLAQTFLINDVPEGVFATSIDLWFTAKSSTIPVSAYIVSVDNGYPTQRVLPFSEVTLNPDDVNIWSSDPSENEGPTNFAFSDPVYLQSGVEYAIVVISNDPKYRIRVARLGGTDEDGKIIQTNPYGGVMFMSQNASTWTPDQTRDMKFVINRAVFDTGVEGSVEFKSIMRQGVKSITVDIAGTNYSGITGVTEVVIEDPVPGFGLTGTTAEAEPIIDLVSGSIRAIRVTNPGAGYTINPNSPGDPWPLVTIIRDIGDPVGIEAKATANMYEAPVSTFSLIQGSLVQKECDLFNSLSFGAHQYEPIEAGETYLPTSEFTITRLNRATITSFLNTTSQYLSPVIDLDGMNLLCIHNQVNTLSTGEDTADAGDALSRYISRETELNDPADQLNIYLDVNRPVEGANILLYVKLKYDSSNYSDWLPISPQVKIPITDDRTQYSEVAYIVDSSANDFISFSVKLVFTATSSVDVATAKNLRIIATS